MAELTAERARALSSIVEAAKAKGGLTGGQWRTVNGAKVYMKGGSVVAGPARLTKAMNSKSAGGSGGGGGQPKAEPPKKKKLTARSVLKSTYPGDKGAVQAAKDHVAAGGKARFDINAKGGQSLHGRELTHKYTVELTPMKRWKGGVHYKITQTSGNTGKKLFTDRDDSIDGFDKALRNAIGRITDLD